MSPLFISMIIVIVLLLAYIFYSTSIYGTACAQNCLNVCKKVEGFSGGAPYS